MYTWALWTNGRCFRRSEPSLVRRQRGGGLEGDDAAAEVAHGGGGGGLLGGGILAVVEGETKRGKVGEFYFLTHFVRFRCEAKEVLFL